MAGIDSEMLESSTACRKGQTRDGQVDGRRGNTKIVVVVVPNEDDDFLIAASSDRIDFWMSADSVADEVTTPRRLV